MPIRSLLVLVFLALPLPSLAGEAWLAWDYDLAVQPRITQYIARYTTMLTPTPRLSEQMVQLADAGTCVQRHIGNYTPETLCGTICLAPGDYVTTLVASDGSQRSPESNSLDVDLTNSFPCTPASIVPPKPITPDSQVSSAAVSTAVIVGATTVAIHAGSPPSLPSLVNLGCVSWAITGPCFCNPFTPCLSVEYWEPGWIVETVKKPGTTSLAIFQPLLDAVFSGGIPVGGGGSGGNAVPGGHTSLHYMEAHVYTFPQLLGGPCTNCAPGPMSFGLNYASEIDPAWRTAVAVPSPLSILEQIGVWSPLYPRGGKSIHGSEVVASGVAATRAIDIAFNPLGIPPNVEARVVPMKTDSLSPCCQLAWPRKTGCFPPGVPPPVFETGSLSMRGTYIWIFWRKRTCCVSPNQTTCGITLPGIGQHGGSVCAIPSTP